MLDVAHSSCDPTFGSPIPAAVSASSNVCMQQQLQSSCSFEQATFNSCTVNIFQVPGPNVAGLNKQQD